MEMLGLSDRSAIRDLFGLVLAGDAPGMLAALKSQYALGTEPAALFRALLELVHGVTRTKVTDRKSAGKGKSVSVRVYLGGRRILQKTKPQMRSPTRHHTNR